MTDTPQIPVQPIAIQCATSGCASTYRFDGGSVSEFEESLNTAHDEGWICLMESVLDMTCPRCRTRRSIQRHQVMRRRLEDQPPWKKSIAVYAWSSMPSIDDDEYLRSTDMPQWLDALLGHDTTPKADRLRQALEHLSSTLERRKENPNAVEAARLARVALGK